ncbi:GNAT family N-acetyltransferase [Enterococcus sp. HY326]|uniref:GNAT family N-acetyltransferase n=1 Tax=Enterococcus sp. HY326 TaxID=2971265 RepID=UPI00223F8804|nr:GNAT family protein [Enterococcus sp. HY326]
MIRNLTQKDAAAYHQFRLQALQETPEAFAVTYQQEKAYTEEQIQKRLADKNQKMVLGFFNNQNLVGIVGCYQEKGLKLAHKGVIFGMYLLPEFRKKGYSQQLLQQLLTEIPQAFPMIEQVSLCVNAENLAAVHLYQKLGFKEYGYEKNALKWNNRYYDEMLMFKLIGEGQNG